MKMVYINPLSHWRERSGVRPKVALWPVDIMFTVSPSLPPYGIPYSLIYAKRPALLCIKNLNDGMSHSDRAGLYPLPRGERK